MGLSDMLGSCELRFLRLHDLRFGCGHHRPVLQAAAELQLYHPRPQDSPAQTDPIMKFIWHKKGNRTVVASSRDAELHFEAHQ